MTLVAALAGALLLLLLSGTLYQVLGTRADNRRYAAPGRLVNTCRGLVHVQDAGSGAPVVVLEAGIAASSLSWTTVQRLLSRRTRVLSYDRPGLGWSPSGKTSRSAGNIAAELHAVLDAAGAAPPYILVGHSFGGLLATVFAARYPADVCGLVLVDPVGPWDWGAPTPAQLRMLSRAVRLSGRGALLARLGVVRFALALLMEGGRLLPKVVARASSGRGAGVMERLIGEVRKLPPEVWPMVRSHWCRPGCFKAMAAYLESLPANAAAMESAAIPSHIPVTVLSASDSPERRLAEHRTLAERSNRGRHIVAKQSGHWILLDDPELVVRCVEELGAAWRAERSGG